MRYRTIVADPPWEYEGFVSLWPTGDKKANRSLPYPSMSLAEISAVPVADFAADDCRLFLWTTNRYLRDAFDVLDAWGFAYKQTAVWGKTNPAPWTGSVAPNAAEFILVAQRGSPARLRRWPSCVVSHKRLAHSQKPETFLDLIEGVSPGPYLELFARRQRLGWDTWGNEALEHVVLAGQEGKS